MRGAGKGRGAAGEAARTGSAFQPDGAAASGQMGEINMRKREDLERSGHPDRSQEGVEPPSGAYTVEKREVLAQTPDLRMTILTLAGGQEVPWHCHTHVTDTTFCLEGPMVIETREPEGRVELTAGQTYAIPARRPHRVHGKDNGRCKFAVLQGVGPYDFKRLR